MPTPFAKTEELKAIKDLAANLLRPVTWVILNALRTKKGPRIQIINPKLLVSFNGRGQQRLLTYVINVVMVIVTETITVGVRIALDAGLYVEKHGRLILT